MALTPAQQKVADARAKAQAYLQTDEAKKLAKQKNIVLPTIPTQPTQNKDMFWDVSGKSSVWQTNKWLKLSTGTVLKDKPKTIQDLGKYNVFWQSARDAETLSKWTLEQRNDIIASNLVAWWKTDVAWITEYLMKQQWFVDASDEDKQNTISAIQKRIGDFSTEDTTTTEDWTSTAPTPWYYIDADWNKVKILGYDDLDTETRWLIDQMTDSEKKLLDMKRWNDIQWKTEYLRQALREKEHLQKVRDYTIKINDLEWNVLEIQASQRLRDAWKNVDNLIQNYAYLWQMGAPWVSSQRLTAVKDAVAEAERKFAELKQIEQNVAQIRELGLEIDTEAFEKTMADIADDLNMKVWSQIQNALNDMTAADLAGQLDTIDWVTQFKRSLLERLDNSISWYTQWSLDQMRYVTEQYTKMADDAQTRITEWNKNANTVNTEMSTAKWYYVDWNGTPIYDKSGKTIAMPEKPPLDPIYDSKTGKLIQFTTDDSWKIVANVQQVTNEATFAQQTVNSYAQLVKSWKLDFKDVPEDIQNAVATAMSTVETGYQWPEYTPVDNNIQQSALQQVKSLWEWSIWWQCGAFVNDYLESMWLWRMFVDPIDKKKAIKNSDTPTVWSIAIMDSPTQPQYWHVWIVIAVNGDWTVTIKQSNNKWDEKIFNSKINKSKIYWYFDPTKWPDTSTAALSVEDANAYRKLLSTKVIAWASKLSDAERENMTASMEQAIEEWDMDYANEILRGVMLNDKRVWDSIYDNEQLKAWLWLVRNTLEEFSKTWNTWLLRSMAEKAANYLGTTTDEQLAKANNQLWVLVADYIRAISGTAASDREVQRLVNNLPNIKNIKSFNLTLLDNLDTIANTKMKTNIELFLWNYKSMASKLFPEVYKTNWDNGNYDDIVGWWTGANTSDR